MGYPQMLVEAGHVEPAPRRVRGLLGGAVVFDTTRALYLWEWPGYPQYAIPVADVDPGALVDEDHARERQGRPARRHALRAGGQRRPGAAWVFGADAGPLADTVRFAWSALDAWFEEDEQVFVHPRNPYARVDALRSRRRVRVQRDGLALAESDATVMVFETGLPTRYYLDRSDVDFAHLVPSDTVTACPYKGRTTGSWSLRRGETSVDDIAWAYDFPTAALLPIAGLVAFYNERVDITVDGVALERPRTHFG